MRFPGGFGKRRQIYEIPAQDLIFRVEIFPGRVFHTWTWISGCVLKHSLIFRPGFKTWVENYPDLKYWVDFLENRSYPCVKVSGQISQFEHGSKAVRVRLTLIADSNVAEKVPLHM